MRRGGRPHEARVPSKTRRTGRPHEAHTRARASSTMQCQRGASLHWEDGSVALECRVAVSAIVLQIERDPTDGGRRGAALG